MEAYVDDMLVKRFESENHPIDLEECFQTLRRSQVKLNPLKCSFRVSAGKFHGYIVHHQGIEVNPVKVKAVLDMPALRSIKEVQSLTGRMTALRRFLSRLVERSLPFYKALAKTKGFAWNNEFQ